MRRFFLFRVLAAALVMLLLFGGMGNMIFRQGYSQGFLAGQVAATTNGEVAQVVSQNVHGFSRGWSPALFCFNIFFLFLAFGLVMKLVSRRTWRRMGRHGHWGGPGRRSGRGRWGGPWHKGGPWYDNGDDQDSDAGEPPKAGVDYV